MAANPEGPRGFAPDADAAGERGGDGERGRAGPGRRAFFPGAAARPKRLGPVLAWTGAGAAFALAFPLWRAASVVALVLLVAARCWILARAWTRSARLRAAEEAVLWDPTSSALYLALAEARLASGDLPGAVGAFTIGIGIDPELSLARPAEVAERLAGRAGASRRRRRALLRLLTASLLVQYVERLERSAGSPPAAAGAWARGTDAEAREARRAAALSSLRLEIAGIEQLASQLHLFVSGEEEERERRILAGDLARLRRQIEYLEGDPGRGGDAQAG